MIRRPESEPGDGPSTRTMGLRVQGRGIVMVPALDYHDPDPPPRGWLLRKASELGEAPESAATRTLRAARSLSPEAMGPGKRRKLKRDLAVLVLLEAGLSGRWVADALRIAPSTVHQIRSRYGVAPCSSSPP